MAQTELKFKVVVDSSGLPRLEQDMAKSFGGMQSNLSGIVGTIGTMFTAGAIYGGVKNMMSFASNIRDTAEAFGVSTDSLQTFEMVLQKAGVGADKLQLAFNGVQNAQGDLINGNTKLIPLLDRLGISANAFAAATPDQVLEMFGKRLASTTTYAQDFNTILQIIPMRGAGRFMTALREIGEQGLPKLNEMMKQSGLILDQSLVNTFDEAEKAQDRFMRAAKIKWGEFLGGLMVLAGKDPFGRPEYEKQLEDKVHEIFNRSVREGNPIRDQEELKRIAARELAGDAKAANDTERVNGEPEWQVPEKTKRRLEELGRQRDRETEQAKKDYDREQKEKAELQQKLSDIRSGTGITTSGGMADRLARIGGYVGGQLDPNARAAERQIKILEEIRDAIRQNKSTNPVPVEDY